jgi:hypothetical protein
LDKKQAARQPPQPQVRRRNKRPVAAPSIPKKKIVEKREEKMKKDRKAKMVDDNDCFDSIVAVNEGCSLIDNKTGFSLFIIFF